MSAADPRSVPAIAIITRRSSSARLPLVHAGSVTVQACTTERAPWRTAVSNDASFCMSVPKSIMPQTIGTSSSATMANSTAIAPRSSETPEVRDFSIRRKFAEIGIGKEGLLRHRPLRRLTEGSERMIPLTDRPIRRAARFRYARLVGCLNRLHPQDPTAPAACEPTTAVIWV